MGDVFNPKLFLVASITFNFLCTSIFAIPFLRYKIWEDSNDDDIPEGDWGQDKKGKHWFTRRELLKNRNFAVAGLIFSALAAISQVLFLII